MNKNLLIGIVLCVALLPFVSAGSITGLDYKDQTSIFGTERNRVISDSSVVVDADSMKGFSYADLDAKWSIDIQDGRGVSENKVLNMLYGNIRVYPTNFLGYIKSLFADKSYEDKYKLLETWAIENGFNPDDDALRVKCSQKFGECGGYLTLI